MKYFKKGLGFLFPLALVVFIINWIYNLSKSLVILVFQEYLWYYPILAFILAIIAIFIIGLILSWIAPLRWLFKKIEKWFIYKIPLVNKLYGFGKEISDSFLADVKEDGDLDVVAVEMLGGESLGVLIDKEHNTVFVPTAPNPTNGFLVRTEKYRYIETMSYVDAIKFVTSIGKINGKKWR
jgi:uncharacterized membrane protein